MTNKTTTELKADIIQTNSIETSGSLFERETTPDLIEKINKIMSCERYGIHGDYPSHILFLKIEEEQIIKEAINATNLKMHYNSHTVGSCKYFGKYTQIFITTNYESYYLKTDRDKETMILLKDLK